MQVPARKLTTDEILSIVLFRGAATREARYALRKDPVAMTIIVVTIKYSKKALYYTNTIAVKCVFM